MAKLDDIKKKLNLEIMDENERKKLFQEFIDHGGKPVELEEEKKKQVQKSRGTIQRGGAVYTRNTSNDNSKDSSKNQQKSTGHEQQKSKNLVTKEWINKNKKNTFVNRMFLNLFSYFNKVSNISGNFFHKNFIELSIGELLESIIDLQKISLIILNSKSFEEFEIKHFFLKKYPFFNELLVRLKKTKVKELIDSIKEKEKTSPGFNLTVSDIEKEIKGLFKEFYLLLSYKKQIPEAYREGFRILEKKESMSDIAVNTYMGRVRRDVILIFEKYMLKLFYAFQLTNNLNLKINSPEIPVILEISDKERVGGMISDLEQEMQNEANKLKEEGQELLEKKSVEEKVQEIEEKLSLPEEVRKGIEILDNIRFDQFGSDKSSSYFNYERKDKVFRVAAILDFFEKEYSFLMTGTKIKYYMEHHEGIRFDPKKELNEVYVDINSVMDNIREYSKQIDESIQTEENSNIPTMQKHNLIHKATIQKTKISMALRAKLSNSIFKLKTILEKIRSNYNKFLADPNQQISFSGTGSSRNHLEGISNKEALEEFYSFTCGFHYSLTKGVLGGAGNVVR